ncbi:hypothetical protein Pla175_07710 [Pirellulimonas nuda]|uniref:Uncharacterized protein n=1 Tax=Pirellulimonas nuda TaxID=2528009 RepID=A0A518D7G8_9BACT|nr:hypothetical protein Pla175_07710 [Pirellulimonas nuda]
MNRTYKPLPATVVALHTDHRGSILVKPKTFLLLIATLLGSGCDQGGFTRVRYDGFEYTWEPGTHVVSGNKLADVYIQTADGKTFYLPDITPENVADDLGWKEMQLAPHASGRLFTQDDNSFRFDGGSLRWFRLCSNQAPRSDPFLLSSNKGGPFVRMPRTKEELVALFGEPNDWAPYHPPTSP